jgi:uncharacterized membrane protein
VTSAAGFELLDFLIRWLHVIAGIMWIGNSLLFNWLDRDLVAPTDATSGNAPLGIIWLLHSGGFYYVEKTILRGRSLPRPLHWFKWQAYTTWWSGMALLFVVYYLSDRAVLADPSIHALGHRAAIGVGFGAIALGWALYESMQRIVAPRAPIAAAATWIVGLAAIAVALTQLLAGRAAFLHVGAMLGTIMAGNVVLTIVPSQRQLVASVNEGRGVDAAVSARAKRVSIHNNYFTFPVIALMVSNHFPALYGHAWNWLVLFVIIASGAAVRHVLNMRFTFGAWKPVLGGVIGASIVALVAVLLVPSSRDATTGNRSAATTESVASRVVTFEEARHIIDRRCAACHSAQPSDLTFGAAPAGVVFDTPEQILARVSRIRERAVVTRTMPPANKTRITDAERAIIARWIDLGAQAPTSSQAPAPR